MRFVVQLDVTFSFWFCCVGNYPGRIKKGSSVFATAFHFGQKLTIKIYN
jgi:hypothetical protein